MIVSEVMTTDLVTVSPDDTLSHAANLLRQHQFHHLPVARLPRSSFYWFPGEVFDTRKHERAMLPTLEGLLTAEDIDIAAAVSGEHATRPWQERHIAEVMHPVSLSITTTTDVAVAARLMVERGLNCLPVVEYGDEGTEDTTKSQATSRDAPAPPRPVLVGLLTRSDVLMAIARLLGTATPGITIHIPLPPGDITPLSRTLDLTAALHIQVHSVIAAPQEVGIPRVASVRLGTIHPTPLFVRLREEQIPYLTADVPSEE